VQFSSISVREILHDVQNDSCGDFCHGLLSPQVWISFMAAISSASPGALGGLRGLVHLRAILGNINVVLAPEQLAIVEAHEEFDDSGDLKDRGTKAMFEFVVERFVHLLERYTQPEQKR
jgi:NAD(P)H-dependent FMN reductase